MEEIDDLLMADVTIDEETESAEHTRFDKKNLCSGCGANFLSVKAFDSHRVGDFGGPIYEGTKMVGFQKSERRCRTPEEIRVRDMESKPGFLPKYDDGKIVTQVPVISWYFPADEAGKERLKLLSEKHKMERQRVKLEG